MFFNKRNLFPFFLVLAVLLSIGAHTTSMEAPSKQFDLLKEKLVTDGLSQKAVLKIYASPNVKFDLGTMSGYFRHREVSSSYTQFSAPSQIALAKTYLQNNQKILTAAETTYAVPKEIIVAILLIETRLGANTGRNSVLNTFSSISALSFPEVRDAAYIALKDRSTALNREEFDHWSNRKAPWAYKELMAFLTWTQRDGVPPDSILGSYAGAFGICQFLPSSLLNFGVDGNGDGKVNLFQKEDAIFSVGNYLKGNGWLPENTVEQNRKAIYAYNNSTPYVDAVFTVAGLLS